MLNIILYQPQIPQNTGNIGRLCALTNSRLHIILPMGFQITDSKLKRSGMDYWKSLDVFYHDDWESFLDSKYAPSFDRIWLFTTKSDKLFWDASYQDEDGILFGNEGSGVPANIHDFCKNNRLKIPQINNELRSMNLSTSVGIATYEALRQIRVFKNI